MRKTGRKERHHTRGKMRWRETGEDKPDDPKVEERTERKGERGSKLLK